MFVRQVFCKMRKISLKSSKEKELGQDYCNSINISSRQHYKAPSFMLYGYTNAAMRMMIIFHDERDLKENCKQFLFLQDFFVLYFFLHFFFMFLKIMLYCLLRLIFTVIYTDFLFTCVRKKIKTHFLIYCFIAVN